MLSLFFMVRVAMMGIWSLATASATPALDVHNVFYLEVFSQVRHKGFDVCICVTKKWKRTVHLDKLLRIVIRQDNLICIRNVHMHAYMHAYMHLHHTPLFFGMFP